jgi:hypothetical protein
VNRAFIGAWLAGEAIVVWRMVHRDHRLPPPGALLGITALFMGLGLVAEFRPAAPLAIATAYGLDVAAFFNAIPAGLGGQIQQAQQATANAEGTGGGGRGGKGK